MKELKELNDRIAYFKSAMSAAIHLFNQEQLVFDLENIGFFTAPASTKYHGSYEGGLFRHSCIVTATLLTLTESNGLSWSRPESPYIVGMFHDLCKVDNYRRIPEPDLNEDPIIKDGIQIVKMVRTPKWEYNPDTLLKGHGEKSVMLLSRYLQLTMEEILCIRYHMGAFTDQKEWSDYTRAVQQYDTVLWTHHADMIATHIIEK